MAEMFPNPDQRGWNSFVNEWAAASPGRKAMILGEKLGLALLFLAAILAARWIVG
jgi:hypothetical protein